MALHYEIEKGVPLPKPGGNRIYPFPSMEVGDSFPFPKGAASKVRSSARKFSLKTSCKFSISDKHCRCWRIS